MPKRLAIAAALGTFLLGWPGMSEQQQSRTHATQDKSSQAQRPVPPTHVVIDPPFPTSNGQPPTSAKPESPQEKPLPRFARPEWVIVYVTIIYALIAWLTLRAIARQADSMERAADDARRSAADASATAQSTLNAIERQALSMRRQATWLKLSAKGTRLNARAALLSAKALIGAERAWIVVKPQGDINEATFKAVASNQGRTPATIISWEYGYGFAAPPDWKLPPVPEYLGEMPWMRGILIAPQNQFAAMDIPNVLFDVFYNHKPSNLAQLCVYGRIIYWHAFSARTEADEPCETRWCFRFRSDAGDYIPYGGEYDRAT